MPAINILQTKSFAERMRKAIEKAQYEKDWDAAFQMLRKVVEGEIKTIEAITAMPMFAAWIQGETLDLGKIKARK